MHIDRHERSWIFISGVFLVTLLLVISYTAFAMGIHVPGGNHTDSAHDAEVETLKEPGVYRIGDNHYEVVILAQVWRFDPGEIRVPEGAKVDFTITSRDVIHGLRIPDTTINAMIVPGQTTRFSYQFKRAGEYLMLCHEYCGIGHHLMSGKIIVGEEASS